MNNLSNTEWPYPIEYDKETEVSADVLVLGGGREEQLEAIRTAP